ncbi:putative AAA family ATPase [Citrifermentans bremense]|uniref:Putative AAA family ATPase n=1 Tax=Citrifermentans bremense TaxID=60035 RepID=A0A6S6M2W7_9BACT|nr:ATP-binding protein [Citrifermentans bremense]BCG47960.1 putative AAA family ATPase [Citrifermentans bremense]
MTKQERVAEDLENTETEDLGLLPDAQNLVRKYPPEHVAERDKADPPPVKFTSKVPRFLLDKDLILPASTTNEIREAITKVRYHSMIYEQWGFGSVDPVGKGCVLNFYGPPGTGKSRAAEALAGEFAMPFLKVDLAELESKFMGDTAKNLREAFRQASHEGALLFFDEADTVLGKRLSSVTQGVDAEINLTRSTMLMEMDDFHGILAFASNFPENYDAAFRRRISHHIRFDLPDPPARERLWAYHLVEGIPLRDEREILIRELAERSEGLSGGYILQCLRLALPMAVNTAAPASSFLTREHLLKALDLVRRGMREVGTDVQERLQKTREMYGIRKTSPEADK